MNKIVLRDRLYKTTYAWFCHKGNKLIKFYEEALQNRVQTSYDPIGETLSCTFHHEYRKLLIVFSKNENGERVVSIPDLGKREVFKRGSHI